MDSQIREISNELKEMAFEVFENLVEEDNILDKLDNDDENNERVLIEALSKYREETGIKNEAMWNMFVKEVRKLIKKSLPQNIPTSVHH